MGSQNQLVQNINPKNLLQKNEIIRKFRLNPKKIRTQENPKKLVYHLQRTNQQRNQIFLQNIKNQKKNPLIIVYEDKMNKATKKNDFIQKKPQRRNKNTHKK